MTERRKQARIFWPKNAELTEKDGEIINAEVETLSPHGISIKSSKELKFEDNSKIKIRLPGGEKTIEANIKKVWALVKDDYRYGFNFTDLKSIYYNDILAIAKKAGASLSQSRRKLNRRTTSADINKEGAQTRRQLSRRLDIPTYPLYIDGRDVFTEDYEYCVVADKAIEFPEETRRLFGAIKKRGNAPRSKRFFLCEILFR